MSRQYKSPPIKEAVCEFRFRSEAHWDLAVPGLIYFELKDDFPRRLPNVISVSSVVIGMGQPEVQAQVDEQLRQDISQRQGLRFWREHAEDGVIVVAPNKLGISHYRPYPSWEGFFPTIQQAFRAYVKVAQPKSIQRIGLRYINEIVFELGTVDLEVYFEFYPYLGAKLPQDYAALQMSLLMQFKDGRDGLRLQLSTVPGETAEQVVARLDLDYFLVQPETLLLEQTSDWLQQAHDRVEEVFEGCLKDSARAMFSEERS